MQPPVDSNSSCDAMKNHGIKRVFWSEHILGKLGIGGELYRPDGKGGQLETGGKPYDYIPRERTYFYKPEE